MTESDEYPPICEYCGTFIEEQDPQCYARDDGYVCDPDPYPDP